MISAAYAAGFFDGEGCVYIVMDAKSNGRLRVEVTQVKNEVLYMLQAKYGGGVKHSIHRTTEQPRSVWGLYSRDDVKRFLEDIYPHTVVKHTEVWLALEFLAQSTWLTGGSGKRTITDEELALRTGFMLALRSQKVPGNKGNRLNKITALREVA